MSGRPRNRGLPGRDGGKDSDVEAELLARIVEGLKQAQKLNDDSRRVGGEIMALEEEIRAVRHSDSIIEQLKRLDELYRTQMRLAESEKKTVDEQDIVNSIAILKTLQASDEPVPRNGAAKARKGGQRPPIVEPEVVESPGASHSPSEVRNELMKRVKGTSQRSSSVASQTRATVKEESADGKLAAPASSATPQLAVGVDVFYKFPKGGKEVEGEGIHGFIKKVWHDKKPVQYDVQDHETDPAGKQTVRRATARELVPIPTNAANLPIFPTGSRVYAKYPETDTFYNAEVRLFVKGVYTLMFEGEEDNRELTVDKRFVLDSRTRQQKDRDPPLSSGKTAILHSATERARSSTQQRKEQDSLLSSGRSAIVHPAAERARSSPPSPLPSPAVPVQPDAMARQAKLPSHASPVFSPVAQPLRYDWSDLSDSSASLSLPHTPGVPGDLLSPVPTPPATPGTSTPSSHVHAEPKSVPVDTAAEDATGTVKRPKLVGKLPVVECVVRARIPTTSGTEMWLHLYQNDSDNKEHLAIVFGNNIRSRSLDAEKAGESEMDRMIRGAYVGRLTPGRTSSRIDPAVRRAKGRIRASSALRHVETAGEIAEDGVAGVKTDTQPAQVEQPQIEQLQVEQPQPTLQKVKPPLVRIHSECYTGETAWSARCDCGEQLDEAARLMSLPASTGGVIVYLRQEGRGIGLASKLKAYNLQDLGNDTVEANLLLRHPADARTYGLATAILCDLGLGTDADQAKPEQARGIRLLTNNPDKVRAVEGPAKEVRVRERVAMVPIAWRTGGVKGVRGVEIERYLDTKIRQMGHMIHD
ncbi:hypothetical protein DV737_g5321, partial [Chaetothyriales sp. CBS 132003]